jgi:hypothetical protein
MERSVVVERLFRPLVGQRSGESSPALGQESGPLQARLRPVPPRRLTVDPLAWRVPDDETLRIAPGVLVGDEQTEGSPRWPQHGAPEVSRLRVEHEPEPAALRQPLQRLDTPSAQSPPEKRVRTQLAEHGAKGETPRSPQSPPLPNDSATHLKRREEASRVQPKMRTEPENVPPPAFSEVSRERPERPSQPVESRFRPEPAAPLVAIPPAPKPQQAIGMDGASPPQAPISEVPPTRRTVELASRQESTTRKAEPIEDRQPAVAEIRPVRTAPSTPPLQTATPKAQQDAPAAPPLQPQKSALLPTPERQKLASVIRAAPTTDRVPERRASQPASPRPSVTLSIGRIEIVTRQPSSPRRRVDRPRGHQIDPGLAFFRQG